MSIHTLSRLIAEDLGPSDVEDFIAEAITGAFGERCPDFEPSCYCCQAWAQYDALKQLGDMIAAGTHVMVPTNREAVAE